MEQIFSRLDGHEQVLFGCDEDTGLRCIIAIHSTRLGPALGGTRWLAYADEDAALSDVLLLSRAMTYKNACAGLDHGGGKAVVLADPASARREDLLRSYGRMIDSLGGRYVTACDVGTTPADMAIVRRETRWATGMDPVEGGSGDSGVMTAHGVHLAMRAAAAAVFGDGTLAGRHIAVQGVGKVGGPLVELLLVEGARVSVADVSTAAVQRFAGRRGVEVVPVAEVLRTDADIVSPNALGAVLDETTIPQLSTRIVCGGANNQLATPLDADRLHAAGVLYAPDFVVNAGGVINVADELHAGGYLEARARARVAAIPATLERVIEVSRTRGVTTAAAAEHVAQRRIDGIGGLRRFWSPG